MNFYLKGIGMLTGMIFGAGMFALPYVFSKAGLFWGIFHFAISFLILIFLHLWYGEIAYYARGKHRFTGYVEMLLGAKAKVAAFLTTLGSFYGSLLIYGILGGIFLSNIFSQFSAIQMSVLFFVLGSVMALWNINKIAIINFYLSLPLFGFIIYLFFTSLPSVDVGNIFNRANIINGDWFLPYGVWLFALTGFSALPDVRDIFSKLPIKNFKKVIWWSLLLSALFYFLFIVSVWGVSGEFTSEDALSGIAKILGRNAFLLGSVIGFLAVFTSFIALAADMRGVFFYDYQVSTVPAWVFTVVPPIVFFFLFSNGFVSILAVIGTLGMGLLGVFIILMRHRMRKMVLSGDPNDLVKPIDGDPLKPHLFWETLILIGVLSAVVYELWRIVL